MESQKMEEPLAMRLLRPSVVQELTTLNRVTIWSAVKAGTFPAPLKISGQGSGGRIAWRASDIEAWIASRSTPAADCPATAEG